METVVSIILLCFIGGISYVIYTAIKSDKKSKKSPGSSGGGGGGRDNKYEDTQRHKDLDEQVN